MPRKLILAAIACAALAGTALAAPSSPVPDPSTLNPAALRFLPPGRIDWKPAAGLPGAETATLVGDPAKPGFYVVMNRFHPGHFSRPHYHPNDRYVMVVSGVWWVGTGTNYDPERTTVPMRPGTFVTHLARQVHYDGARSGGEDVVVMIFGQGPGARVSCDGPGAETGPGPCADARAAAAKR